MSQNTSELQPLGYATFQQRAHAYLIDCLIFFPINYFANLQLYQSKDILFVLLVAVIWILYKPAMEWKHGATVGKMLVGIRVVGPSMQYPSFNQAMMRFLPFFAVALSSFLTSFALMNLPGFTEATTPEEVMQLHEQLPTTGVVLSYLFLAFSIGRIFTDEKKQAFHDKISDTSCVLVQKAPPQDDFMDDLR